jgi:hypothetical protein
MLQLNAKKNAGRFNVCSTEPTPVPPPERGQKGMDDSLMLISSYLNKKKERQNRSFFLFA